MPSSFGRVKGSPLERDVSHKYYAPGIGIIKDDEFELAERPRVTR